MRAPLLFLLLPLSLTLATPSMAQFMTLTTGADNTIYESELGTLSNGLGIWLFAGTNGSQGGNLKMRALISFDLTELPDDAIIQNAELIINTSTPKTTHYPAPLQLHKLDSDWGEGTSDACCEGLGGEANGAPASPGDATWIHTFHPGAIWDSPGGDFDPVASAIVTATADDAFTFFGSEMAADVQSWVDDPETNFGWMIRLSNESAPAVRFRSFQHPSISPLLRVTYTPEPSATLGFWAAGLTLLALRRRA